MLVKTAIAAAYRLTLAVGKGLLIAAPVRSATSTIARKRTEAQQSCTNTCSWGPTAGVDFKSKDVLPRLFPFQQGS
jgi:hypothetical protein